MPTTIESLPYELLSQILTHAADLNLHSPDAVTYTYGLTQAGRPSRPAKTEHYLRGRTPPDILAWASVSAFRHVNSRWHEWALSHSLRSLYIRRWRGGETWLRPSSASTNPQVVYQDPYTAVRATARLFSAYPHLAAHVRRLWFNGIYRPDTIPHIFAILQHCSNVRAVSLPWTSLRYADAAQWQHITSFPRLAALEFLAVDLKAEIRALPAAHTDLAAIPSLDLAGLRRLKLGGDANLLPLTDADLVALAPAATGLRELLVNGVATVSIDGIAALVAASRDTLELLDYSPSTTAAAATDADDAACHCALLASCPHLRDLSLTLPHACPTLFSNPAVAWTDTARLRLAAGSSSVEEFVALLASARALLEVKPELVDIEISRGAWVFETRARRVHGLMRIVEGSEWRPAGAWVSEKGPYCAAKGEWMCVSEGVFWEGVQRGGLVFA
ncbi:hypothetical protein EDC01DRAFT_490422 [Geopyxis carbonaria]|nr:hypothetical protein EDC01DRAFT_490422 [Geopyxis carbonaria]